MIARHYRLSCLLALALSIASSANAAILTPSGVPDPTHNSNAMLLWLKADAGVTADGSNNVSAWADQSTRGNNATLPVVPTGFPILSPTGLGGKPAILFPNGPQLEIPTSPNGEQTMFIVYRDTSTAAYVTPLGTVYSGFSGAYHGAASGAALFDNTQAGPPRGYTDPATINGLNYRDGLSIGTGESTPRLSPNNGGWSLDAHVATNPMSQGIHTIAGDNCCGRPINGGIAEILVYNYPLTTTEVNAVGYYLESKYSLNTAYVPEPSSLALLGAGGLGMLGLFARRRRAG